MEEFLISVIIPVYNIEELLPRCVNSVCAQTYSNLEILLVDDGSTDGSGQLCENLAEKDSRIRVFHKENGGSSSARNLGIRQARGVFLGFVDSDDYIEPDMYERLVHAVTEQEVSIAQIGRNEIDQNGEWLPDICVPPKKAEFYSTEEFLRELLLHKGDCSFCTKLIARGLFEQEMFPEGALNEDFHLLVKLLPKAGGVYSLPGYGYHVFYRIGSNTRKEHTDDFPRVFADNIDNADMVLAITKAQYPGLEKIAVRFGLFQRLDYLLHVPIARMQKENGYYGRCITFIRHHLWSVFTSKYLTAKNKLYLLTLGLCPRITRKTHAALKRRSTVTRK